MQAGLEPLEVILEPLPRRVEIIRLQEGVAIEQRLKVTEGMHDEEEEDCEVEREMVATEERARARSQSTRPTSEVVCQNSMPCVALRSANRA